MHRFMDWREILAAMTTVPARRLGEAGERGEVVAGQAADIVLLSADPAQDYRHLGAVDRVRKQGRLVFWRGVRPAAPALPQGDPFQAGRRLCHPFTIRINTRAERPLRHPPPSRETDRW